MKPNEIRELSDDALFERAAQLRESLFRLRFKLALGNQDTVRQLRNERKDLARVKTELRAREVAREIEEGTRPRRRPRTRAERREKTARRMRGQARAAGGQ
jgi:large subunit ribosomal protein L29